jgi:undecaprenyl pyrophosphate phosphatase UppP
MYSVLYVDDETGFLEINKCLLEKTGDFSVDTAQSAPEALGKIRNTGYDVIVSDYNMPDMDGIELLKQVRSTYGDLPFLLFTGLVGIPLLLAEKHFFPTLDAGILYALMGAGLIVTGILLLSHKGGNTREIRDVGWKDGILTGMLQGLSTLPGISRSGTSTTGLIWRGFDSGSSFYLSFLLSIPTVVLAEILLSYGSTGMNGLPVADGIILLLTSLGFGYLTLDVLLNVVKRVNIAYLVLALGILIIAVGLTGVG